MRHILKYQLAVDGADQTVVMRVGDGEYPSRVAFNNVSDENGEVFNEWTMPAALFRDLGEPTTLTITVEPGDLLNEPPAHDGATVDRYIQKGPEEWGMWACTDCGAVVWAEHTHDSWHRNDDDDASFALTEMAGHAQSLAEALRAVLGPPTETGQTPYVEQAIRALDSYDRVERVTDES